MHREKTGRGLWFWQNSRLDNQNSRPTATQCIWCSQGKKKVKYGGSREGWGLKKHVMCILMLQPLRVFASFGNLHFSFHRDKRETFRPVSVRIEIPGKSIDIQRAEHSLKEQIDQKKSACEPTERYFCQPESWIHWGREYLQRTQYHDFSFIWVLYSNLQYMWDLGKSPD